MTTTERIQLLGGNVQGQAPHTGATNAIDRLGIPAVYFTDGSVGIRQGSATQMPTPTGLAAAFDPAMAGQHGVVIAAEAKDKGNDVVYGPTVNIARNPQGGRSYESYGEEPFLVARTAVGWIDGAQSTGVIADVKHFAGNNQEGQDVAKTGRRRSPGWRAAGSWSMHRSTNGRCASSTSRTSKPP